MTNETSAALLYGILPSIREICGKDQQAEKALIQTFLKAEKHAPGFSDDFMRSFHKQAEAVPYPYEATILATSSQHLREFQLSNDSELAPLIQSRADNLKKILSSIPRVIPDRPIFLQTIKDIASNIRMLLDALNQRIEINRQKSRASTDRLDMQKREFVRFSKRFSEALKEYFQDRCDERKRGVFREANRLLHQTNQVLNTLRHK